MAVYTPVTAEQMSAFLSLYELGELISYEGIEQGVSNTNYTVTSTTGRYILTLYEPHRVQAADVPRFIDYSARLEQGGVPCPHTLPRKDSKVVSFLCDRPATLVSFLKGVGQSASTLTPAKCRAAGETLARMHLAVSGFSPDLPNHFGLRRWGQWLIELGAGMDVIGPGLHDLTSSTLSSIQRGWPEHLPQGAIHADYFPDNVFFSGDEVTGVIDFHFVCIDFYAYDLAIAVNAWCFDSHNNFVPERMQNLLTGYQSMRGLLQSEAAAFPVLLQAAALRFLLSRIEEKLKWKEGDFMVPHDPLVFSKRLMHWLES